MIPNLTREQQQALDAVRSALRPETRLVFVETIANPRTQVADLARIGALCAERGIVYVVDNTMTSPYLFVPKRAGASLVVNALTKYIGGHGNALGGSITDNSNPEVTPDHLMSALFRQDDTLVLPIIQKLALLCSFWIVSIFISVVET
jgi:O-acetylhomoserine/O-acetylserine sulfhydrylase-like pyridoxal-dependent enzyme